jgi:hypothetical protein
MSTNIAALDSRKRLTPRELMKIKELIAIVDRREMGRFSAA